MKQLGSLKDEIAKLRVTLAAQEKKMQIANNAQASLLESERLKCHSQIRSLKKCPPPTGCYIALGVTGAVCVGLGIGGYALGRAK